jgi:class 3 adenylate cyclase/tetratricopeptide (TPR) repeat protein
MKCPRCQAENPDATRFCEQCGIRLDAGCPHCGQRISATSKFCSACGAAVVARLAMSFPEISTPKHLAEKILRSKAALEGERKHVTVLFADMKGSLELLADRDPEDARSILDPVLHRMMDAVHRYEGTVNQVMGDGIMALFGAPVAHEDHAARACQAAILMQEEVKRYAAELQRREGVPIQIRVGLNCGRVFVRSISSDLRMDYTAVGETTHLASRMEQMAMPGSILVTEDVRRLAGGSIRTRPVGRVEIRGLRRSVDVHEVLGAATVARRLDAAIHRGLSPVVGRGAEFELMRRALARTRDRRGEVVLLVGEAGIGKSRLLHEFKQTLAGERVTYLEGRCVPYGATVPFMPLIEMLRGSCRLGETDTPVAIAEKVRASVERLGIEADEAAPYLLRLLGLAEGTKQLEALTPETINARTFDIFWRMALHGSRQRPLVLAFDDVHWIDRASEAYIAAMIERLPAEAILLLLTHRPGYRQPWVDRSYVTRIAVRPLLPQEAMTIVRSVAAADVPDDVRELVVRKAEGNPFFLEEMGRALGEPGAQVTVPDTIEGVLMARIDRLAEQPKRLLQVASIVGREFSPRLLEAVWDDSVSLVDQLDELTRLEFLDEQPGERGTVYAFRHSLIQEVVYESLPMARREVLHAAAGAALESLYAGRLQEVYDALGYHYGRTTDAGKAVHYLRALAVTSARSFAHAEAVAATDAALAHVDRLPADQRDRWRGDLALQQALSLFLLGRFPDALRVLLQHRAPIERSGDAGRQANYHFLLANTYAFLGELDEATAAAHRSLAAGAASGQDATMGKASYVLAVTSYSRGEPDRGVAHARDALARLTPAGNQRWTGQACWALSINQILLGRFTEAREACERARRVGAAVGDPRLEKSAAWTIGFIDASVGRSAEGIDACKQGLEDSPNPLNTALASGFLGYAYLEAGAAALAIPVLETAVASMSNFRLRQNHGWFLAFLAEAYRVNGEVDKARQLASEASGIARHARFAFGVGWALRVLGRAAADRGDLDEARRHLDEALATFETMHAEFEAARTHVDVARVARRRGDADAAGDHERRASERFQALGIPQR